MGRLEEAILRTAEPAGPLLAQEVPTSPALKYPKAADAPEEKTALFLELKPFL